MDKLTHNYKPLHHRVIIDGKNTERIQAAEQQRTEAGTKKIQNSAENFGALSLKVMNRRKQEQERRIQRVQQEPVKQNLPT